ncbi:hypothetical protein IQ241_21370 [Romeria aff. gracilis LEGE 07310]|uniref:Tetratricopeptide repeat protein n=1 Tax=Vasconcelosia minhoensis LEGE 07310 TaxID=915328 RepID=A0A8J7B0A8_9CYAN|nr:hypothetical protein [Romeria gracilis]MBE9079812.1 hypothetical protein [Romeria aff. gracilis LEGE 07310]
MPTIDTQFDEGLQRYKDGEAAETLIPVFKEICTQAPKNSAARTCLAWLYLLDDRPNAGFKAAQKAVKLNPQDPQARVNLAIAMLDSGKSGVREQIERVSQMIQAVEELRNEVKTNLEEGLSRKPDWKGLIRVRDWLFGR